MMIKLLTAIITTIMIATTFIYPSFAMHDSTLNVSSWIKSDNSTDLHTTDLIRSQESTENETTMMIIEQPSQYQWLTYDDPILQFSIGYPSNWTVSQGEDTASFEISDTNEEFNVLTEPFLSLDPSEYAREKLNEQRKYGLEIIGLNETSINRQPAAQAQYRISTLPSETMALSYFMVTDDYTGYRLLYAVDDDEFSRYLPIIERMVSTFRITK
jgi:hypothetical protein